MSDSQTAAAPRQPRAWWVWLKRLVTWSVFILVPVMLYALVKNLDWQEVSGTLRAYKASTLLIGAGIALASYLVFASYDLLARRYTGHDLPARQVVPLAFVCYAFNLNLSSWVGGIALRYRLYSRLGLKVSTITRIFTINLITNWLGYLFVAGALFVMGLPALPEGIKIGTTGLRLVGAGMILTGVLYLLACAFSKRREWHVRGHAITLPGARMALLQAALAAINWSLMGLLVFWLLPDKVGYPTVLAILLISSIAGVIAHIPAGLGVLETIFITLLQGQYSKGALLAALIAYRALYFLMPLVIACVVYLWLERKARQAVAANPQ